MTPPNMFKLTSSLLLLPLALLLCTTGCVTVTFPEPMPMHRRDLKSFPKSWQGDWRASQLAYIFWFLSEVLSKP